MSWKTVPIGAEDVGASRTRSHILWFAWTHTLQGETTSRPAGSVDGEVTQEVEGPTGREV